jgi:large-conductance mechanosensitive channel
MTRSRGSKSSTSEEKGIDFINILIAEAKIHPGQSLDLFIPYGPVTTQIVNFAISSLGWILAGLAASLLGKKPTKLKKIMVWINVASFLVSYGIFIYTLISFRLAFYYH